MEAFGVWSPDNSGKESNVSLDFVQFSQMARQLSPLPLSRVLSAKLPKVFLDETQSLKGTGLVNAWEAGFCGSHERERRERVRKEAEALYHLHKFATELQMEPISDGIREIKVRETEWSRVDVSTCLT